jgi:hypothetical protein
MAGSSMRISSAPLLHNLIYLVDGELINEPSPSDSHFMSIAEIVSAEEHTTFGHFLEKPPVLKAFIVASIRTEPGEINK